MSTCARRPVQACERVRAEHDRRRSAPQRRREQRLHHQDDDRRPRPAAAEHEPFAGDEVDQRARARIETMLAAIRIEAERPVSSHISTRFPASEISAVGRAGSGPAGEHAALPRAGRRSRQVQRSCQQKLCSTAASTATSRRRADSAALPAAISSASTLKLQAMPEHADAIEREPALTAARRSAHTWKASTSPRIGSARAARGSPAPPAFAASPSEQPRQRPVRQQPAAGLAPGAVVGLVVRVDDALDRRAADRAGLAVPAVHRHPVAERGDLLGKVRRRSPRAAASIQSCSVSRVA